MWFVLWTFGIFIIGIIPVLCYIMPSLFYSLPVSFDTVKTSDIAIIALAFNWTNFNETFNIMSNKDPKGLNKINKASSVIILSLSIIFTFLLGCILICLNVQEIMEKQSGEKSIMMLDEAIIRSCTMGLGVFSLLLNLIFYCFLKHK